VPPTAAPRIVIASLAIVLAVSCRASSPSPVQDPTLPATPDALPTMDGETFARLLEAQHGTPVLVNFWASWCKPACENEAPILAAAHARWRDRVRFIGVDMSDYRGGAANFIQEHGIRYPNVFDPVNAIATSFDILSPPVTLFFDANGNLVRTIPGELSERDLEEGLEQIAGPASGS
jgi:cytochrome c biogenesis protein CcmG/thiol:disulfide interchange protein DsbE